jgi:cellulose synthase/poly-beta-1,6-N-acetylglucosamine synthase-like glycosyltransferase
VGSYGSYFVFLRGKSKAPWGLSVDPKFEPSITVLVPAFNEEKFIYSKLENLRDVDYPKSKMDIVLIDDASSDATVSHAESFIKLNPAMKIRILRQPIRQGKANGLNLALKDSSNNLIVVTDADTFWPADILSKSLPYMSDETIGAISGIAQARNITKNWVTSAEKNYLNMMSYWRLGESKVSSTIRFEGCFCVFRKSAFTEFDSKSGADDSGTALAVIQNGYRAILVPEAKMEADMPSAFSQRFSGKTRRAVHLTGLWVQCTKLLFRGRLKLPLRIALPEIILSLIMPFVFAGIVILTFVLLFFYSVFVVILLVALGLASLLPKIGTFVVQGISDQFVLIYAIFLYSANKRFVVWNHERS